MPLSLRVSRWPAAVLAMTLFPGDGSAQEVLAQLEGLSSVDTLGYSACGVGDINADGFADILLTESTGGRIVRLRSGIDLTTVYEFHGEAMGDALDAAGDVNLDGFVDFLVGSPSEGAGNVRVYSGRDGTLIRLHTGAGPSAYFGGSVSRAGDVNADGADDVLIGAAGDSTSGNGFGRASLYSGLDGSLLRTHFGQHIRNWAGSSVTETGDLDADGIEDYAVGFAGEDASGMPVAGGLRVFSGASGAEIWSHFGDVPGMYFGASADRIGDVDQDGVDDLISGAPMWGWGNNGNARVLSGRNGSQIHELRGANINRLQFGFSVSRAGDIDGDGIPDMIASGPSDISHTGWEPGQAQVHSGRDGSMLFRLHGAQGWAGFGWVASGPGDVNGDGVPDLMVGAPGYGDNWGNYRGRLVIYSGTCRPNRQFGSGCAGSGGHVPSLTLEGCATPGGPITLGLRQGLGGAQAFLAISPNQGSTPLRGCELLVLPPDLSLLPVRLSGNGPGLGELSVPFNLPLTGVPSNLVAQMLILDPGVPGLLSASNGVGFPIP